METQPEHDGSAFLRGLFARAIRPDPRRTVAEWAQAERVVAEGPEQGPWRNARTPYLVEIMERCSLHCPTRRVSFLGSAQIAKTQVGLNLAGQILSETPTQVLIALPSINSMRMYNRDKLDRMIQASPALKSAVADLTERSGQGSTTAVKRGARGAQVELVTASSSRDLQSRTVRVLIREEISEYDEDVGGRGDPMDQLEARTIAFRKVGEKIVDISTPGIASKDPGRGCKITREYQAGSRGTYQVACPHCDERQALEFANLRWAEGQVATAAYHCEACGAAIGEHHKPAMLAGGRWVHERPELLDAHASYRLNTLYSPFVPWPVFAAEYEKTKTDPSKLKTFTQQWLGQAWDEAFDLPKAEVLLLRRDGYRPGSIPAGVLFLTGATDVQGNRLVWAVWGFDQAFGQWLIEHGTIEGDPTRPEVWAEHDALLQRRWRDAWGKEVGPESWGIDAGYLSSHVYGYVRRHAGRAEPMIRALDGRAGWRLLPLGTPVQRDVDWHGKKLGSVQLWPVGTWDLKSELSAALRLTEQGPGPEGWPVGALRFNELADMAWLNELLSERYVENPRTGKRSWEKVNARNEAWDLAVYCRAQARHETLHFTPETWAALAARRLGAPEDAQGDLMALMVPDLRMKAEQAKAQIRHEQEIARTMPAEQAEAAIRKRGGGWFERRDSWF